MDYRGSGSSSRGVANLSLVVTPILATGAFLAGGIIPFLLVALLTPAAFLGWDWFKSNSTADGSLDRSLGILSRQELLTELEQMRLTIAGSGRSTAIFAMRIDDLPMLRDRHGERAMDHAVAVLQERMRASLRGTDFFARLDPATFSAVLSPVSRLDLEASIQLSTRLQSEVAEPISFSGQVISATVSIGFCQQTRLPQAKATQLLEAAETAMEEAHRNGPAAIRAFVKDMLRRSVKRTSLHEQIADALENGEILPHFQAQVSTDTGQISGVEALARWKHPEIGLIPPAEFLPVVYENGLSERLGEVMLYQSLTALRRWDAEGIDVPKVGVNFAGVDLRNPKLCENIRWELDRFETEPGRLTIEVLETVFDDEEYGIVTRNIRALRDMGCGVDLDDFGIGQASIAHIQTFRVNRIKIDRSFVSKIDVDENQRKLVAAILHMAEELGVETLAEGVETRGEHAILSQLGCQNVQGFGIARPMPFDAFLGWARAHEETRVSTMELHRRAV